MDRHAEQLLPFQLPDPVEDERFGQVAQVVSAELGEVEGEPQGKVEGLWIFAVYRYEISLHIEDGVKYLRAVGQGRSIVPVR